jgi:hypothetical protein
MNSRLDNYIKEKIRDHGITPSPDAWEKVETRISKKNSAATALKIAAALAIVGLVSIILWDQSNDNGAMPVAERQNISPPNESSKNDATKESEVRDATRAEAPETHKVQARTTNRSIDQPLRKKNPELQATVIPDPVVIEPVNDEEHLVAPVREKPKAKNIVIVYTLPTINKQITQDVVVTDEGKKTGLQKVMDVAMDVRASEIPLGELREAKDDLFALEFKKDKTKTKN